MLITREDVLLAARRIEGRVRRTPLLAPAGRDGVWLKAEFLQHCGVFKTRGAFAWQLASVESGALGDAGIVIASGGNAGLAHAFAAQQLGLRATVFVPEAAPEVKVARIRGYGADVRRVGTEYAEAHGAAVEFSEEIGAGLAHAYDLPEVAAGAGTLAEEMLEDEPSIDTIVVAVGGGGLYAGVAAAARGRARVVAVEPERCPTLHDAMSAGHPVDVAVSGVAADSLGARRVGDLAFAAQQAEAPVSVLVSDEEIVAARAALWAEYRIASEHGAATAYAALLSGRYLPEPGERVALVVCGANTDPATGLTSP
ncbi:threonine/serine dehydratase [Nocardioides sp. T2.26MG-1]|uniref:threonine/serine dehydratase n=1 Tax=Nocardioides sp. T2.26MG-1 TaxID=3041166 RepID=UPI0024778B78|nr:threonine/serine dehydratase [Nocardioides sp. T2.26MG-1]CAI9419383.1 Phenylserine dehydratase [Nocardioides sp. T2.26MG-1]